MIQFLEMKNRIERDLNLSALNQHCRWRKHSSAHPANQLGSSTPAQITPLRSTSGAGVRDAALYPLSPKR